MERVSFREFITKKFKAFVSWVFPDNGTSLQKILFFASLICFFGYCFSIPMFSNTLNYVSIILCGLMCVVMGIYIILYGRININLMVGLLILFNITTIVTHLINNNFNSFPKTIILMSVVAILLYEFLSSTKKTSLFLFTLLFAGFVFALIYIYTYRDSLFNIKNLFNQRLGSKFDNENELSKEFGFLSVVSLIFLFKSKKLLNKVLFGLSLILFLFLILSTGSISNILTTAIVLFLSVFFCLRKKRAKLILILALLILIGIFVVLLQLPFMSYFNERISNIFKTLFNFGKENYDGSTYDRFSGALSTFVAGFDRVIFGFGYMSGTHFTNNYIQAHNNFSELFVDFGFCGLIVFEALIFIPLIKEKKENEKRAVLSILLYMFIFQLFLTTYYKKFEYIFFAYIYAVLDDLFPAKITMYDSNVLAKKRKLTIFEIIPALSPVGGAEMLVVDLVNEIKKQCKDKADVKLILLYDKQLPEMAKTLKKSGVEIITLKKKKGLDFGCAFRLRELIFKYRPQVIHTHLFALTTLKIALPIRRKNIRCYHTIHHNFSKNNINHKFLKYLVKTKYLIPVCVAKTPSEEYEKYFGKKTLFINNGINLLRYHNSIPLAKREIDFLMVGRFVEIKNHEFIVNLFKTDKRLSKHSIVFLGDGPLYDYCKNLVNENNLNQSIKFEGFVNNANEFMEKSKVLVIPSLNEGNPIVINEAFASGMLVVGNDVGGIHNLLVNNKNGVLSNTYNRFDFADKMIEQIEKAEQTNNINVNDISTLDISLCAEKYLQLFGVNK